MIPNILINPWKTIEAEIKARGLNQKEVAKRLWTSEKNLVALLKWEISISPDMALKLEYVFWIDAEFRLNFEKLYQEQKIKLSDQKQLEEEQELLSNYLNATNKNSLIKLWYLTNSRDKLNMTKQMKQFFWVSSFKAIESIYKDYVPESDNFFSYYRMNDKFFLYKESLYTFFRIWELDANKQDVNEFKISNKKNLLNELHKFLKYPSPNLGLVTQILNKYWIYFSFLSENLDKLPIKWFVRYYKDNPLLQVTSKWKFTDIFWFNLYHELWHIFNHLTKKKAFIDGEKKIDKEIEYEADDFANKYIISQNLYELLKDNHSFKNLSEISKISWVHKWILAWKLAYDWIVDWNKISRLRWKINF